MQFILLSCCRRCCEFSTIGYSGTIHTVYAAPFKYFFLFLRKRLHLFPGLISFPFLLLLGPCRKILYRVSVSSLFTHLRRNNISFCLFVFRSSSFFLSFLIFLVLFCLSFFFQQQLYTKHSG